jgi:hypothetical protein
MGHTCEDGPVGTKMHALDIDWEDSVELRTPDGSTLILWLQDFGYNHMNMVCQRHQEIVTLECCLDDDDSIAWKFPEGFA